MEATTRVQLLLVFPRSYNTQCSSTQQCCGSKIHCCLKTLLVQGWVGDGAGPVDTKYDPLRSETSLLRWFANGTQPDQVWRTRFLIRKLHRWSFGSLVSRPSYKPLLERTSTQRESLSISCRGFLVSPLAGRQFGTIDSIMSSIGTAVISMSRCECRMLCLISHRKVFESIPMVCNRCQKGGYGRMATIATELQRSLQYSLQRCTVNHPASESCSAGVQLPCYCQEEMEFGTKTVTSCKFHCKMSLDSWSFWDATALRLTGSFGPGQAAWKMCPSWCGTGRRSMPRKLAIAGHLHGTMWYQGASQDGVNRHFGYLRITRFRSSNLSLGNVWTSLLYWRYCRTYRS